MNNLLSSEIPRPTVDIFKTHLNEEISEQGKLYLDKTWSYSVKLQLS